MKTSVTACWQCGAPATKVTVKIEWAGRPPYPFPIDYGWCDECAPWGAQPIEPYVPPPVVEAPDLIAAKTESDKDWVATRDGKVVADSDSTADLFRQLDERGINGATIRRISR